MLKELELYCLVMKNGRGKGQVNTFRKKVKYIGRNILMYGYLKGIAQFIISHRYLREKHIYFSDHYRKKKEGKVHANYDEFWESLDGVEKDGMWLLPERLERKSIEDIPSKKRSLYQNKFNLLDSIFEKVDKKLE